MNTNLSDDEAERRQKVAQEKLWGAIIEAVERLRRKPLAQSIGFRLIALYQSIINLQNTVQLMGMSTNIDPLKTPVPPFTTEQANFLIRTYNDIALFKIRHPKIERMHLI